MTASRSIAAASFALSLSLVLAGGAVAREKASDTQVTCKDGTTSKGGRGACRGHGGVDKSAARGERSGEDRADTAKKDKDDDRDRSEARDRKDRDDDRSEARERKGDDDDRDRSEAKTDQRSRSKADDEGRGASKERSRARADNDEKEGPATAKCKDGTLSYSKSRSGTCSRHGGVAEWLTKGN